MDSWTLKPYSKSASVTAANTQVTLTDTAGSSISCNYIKVSPVTSGLSGVSVFVNLSSLGNNPAISIGNAASGSLGFIASDNSPTEMFLPGGLRVTSIFLTSVAGPANPVVTVTYGILVAPNPLKGRGENLGR